MIEGKNPTRKLKYFYRSHQFSPVKHHVVSRLFDEDGEEIIVYKSYSRRKGWKYEAEQWKYFCYAFRIGLWVKTPNKNQIN